VTDTDFGGNVTFSVRMRSESVAGFSSALTEMSNGKLSVVIMSEEFAAM